MWRTAVLPNKRLARIRSVDKCVTGHAWRHRRRPRIEAVPRARAQRTVALIAQRCDGRHIQQPRILRSVRRMAGQAALGLYRSMLIHERSANICVTLGADCILVCSRPQIVRSERAVYIVAIRALDQTLIHAVMNRHVELRLLVRVALVAKRGLSGPEQVLLILALVDAVAGGAADVGFGMRRALEVGVRACVAGKAGCVHFFRGTFSGIEYLGYISAGFNMRFARTMAVLTGDAAIAVHQDHLAVRVVGESLCLGFVTRGADIGADKVCGIHSLGLQVHYRENFWNFLSR